MIHDGAEGRICEHFEISTRFRSMIEQRITRLESDAALDELAVMRLGDEDHIRRQLKLVAAQREDANRMRLFLERSRTRIPIRASAQA